MKFWRLALGVTAALAAADSARAQDIGFANVGMISATMGVNDGRICTGEYSRGDIGCAANAPYISRISGNLGIGTTTPSVSLHIVADVGQTIGAGPGSGLLNLRDSSGLSLSFDSNEFQAWSLNSPSHAYWNRYGGGIGIGILQPPSSTLHVSGSIQFTNTANTCNSSRAGSMRWNGTEFQVCYGSGGWATLSSAATSGTAVSADRITSGTTSIVANDNGYTSLTTGGVNTGYFDTAGRLVTPGVSITTLNGISSTKGYFSNNVGIGISGASNQKVKLLTSSHDATAFGIYGEIRPTVSTTGTYYHVAETALNTPAIANGATNSGYARALNVAILRRLADDEGTLASLRGLNMQFGHYSAIAAGRTTTQAVGIYLEPFAQNGTIQDLHDLYISARLTGGTVGRHISIYQEPSAEAVNYLGNATGIGTGVVTPSSTLHVAGALRIAEDASATLNTCDANRAGAIKWNGTQFQVCYGSGGWAHLSSAAVSGTSGGTTGDRITSGTTFIVAQTGGAISITTNGVTTAYWDAAGRLIGGVAGFGTASPSATVHVSGTIMAKTAANDNACTADQDGAIRYNSTTGRLQICRPE